MGPSRSTLIVRMTQAMIPMPMGAPIAGDRPNRRQRLPAITKTGTIAVCMAGNGVLSDSCAMRPHTMQRLATSMLLAALLSCRPASSPPAPLSATPAALTPVEQFNRTQVEQLLASIKGRENAPAGEVFVNLQLPGLKTESARTFLGIMSGGYARALGVTCEHCHVVGDYASDTKRPKNAAREMALMHRMINQELRKMQSIATPTTGNRSINCMTCHRGTVNAR